MTLKGKTKDYFAGSGDSPITQSGYPWTDNGTTSQGTPDSGSSPDYPSLVGTKSSASPFSILLGEQAHLIGFPSLLLPPGVTAGSIVNIAVYQNHAEDKKQDDEILSLQDELSETFGKRSPVPPKLNMSITVEGSPLEFTTSKLRSLDIYKNRPCLASIPNPLQNASTKFSDLELDTEYSIQLATCTTMNTSSISVCFGTHTALEEMGMGWSNKIQIDTIHFVCTTPAETPMATQANRGSFGASGPGVEYQRAMVPTQQFYLGNPQTPSSSSHPWPQPISQAMRNSPASPTANQDTPPSQQTLGPIPEEVEEKSDVEEEGTSRQPACTGRRREGTMNKSFKFPADPTPSEPVRLAYTKGPIRSRSGTEDKQARKSEESDEVAMVAPSNIEVPPPPPIEKE
ncbi:hypothetical protein BDM02DRAFT_3155936 [Thelephora ganbajun]|uniref:Uncharacterized protein n=1 Tax=Thelephora ganbajun TaxID=370292 RepID=A0ACB6ZFQ0_THEGA|nr:hypothetical protein BDM02DRAFT_3155936 [Thelephora ganbajun]